RAQNTSRYAEDAFASSASDSPATAIHHQRREPDSYQNSAAITVRTVKNSAAPSGCIAVAIAWTIGLPAKNARANSAGNGDRRRNASQPNKPTAAAAKIVETLLRSESS